MLPSVALQTHREAIRRIALSHRVTNVRVFGSVVHGDDTEGSDLDLLVDPTSETTMMDIGAIRHELKQLLGIPVDVLTPRAIPDHFKSLVLREATPV
jgi:predicted nucleotidyltransferase